MGKTKNRKKKKGDVAVPGQDKGGKMQSYAAQRGPDPHLAGVYPTACLFFILF